MLREKGLVSIFLTCAVAGAANVEYIKSCFWNHFSDTRHHVVNRQYKMAAKEYIYNEFTRFGLETEYFTFTDFSVSTESNFTSVVGVLKGTKFGTANDKLVGIGAHYDTVNNTKGVEDNGSGVVAMLEVARQIADLNSKGSIRGNTVIFAAFDLEEYGLGGSLKLIRSWLNPWLARHYGEHVDDLESHGVIVLDSVMFYNGTITSQSSMPGLESIFPETYKRISSDNWKGDFLAIVYRKPTPDAELAMAFNQTWEENTKKKFELESLPLPYEQFYELDGKQQLELFNYTRSDHVNFWVNDIPAILLTDTVIFRNDINKCYHRPCDDLNVLTDDNINFLGKTADVLTMTLHKLSDPVQDTNKARKHTDLICSVTIMILFYSIFNI